MTGCVSCGLPPMENEGKPALLLPDGWGWLDNLSIVCPTCLRLGEHADHVAARGEN